MTRRDCALVAALLAVTLFFVARNPTGAGILLMLAAGSIASGMAYLWPPRRPDEWRELARRQAATERDRAKRSHPGYRGDELP